MSLQDYRYSNLNKNEIAELTSLEKKLNSEKKNNEEMIIIAFSKNQE